MNRNFVAIFSILFLNYVSTFKYYYITSDESIHSGESVNGSITGLSKDTVALAIYENNVNITGWANLELQTFDGFEETVQSYMAGFLEGYITGELIRFNFQNNIEGYCDLDHKFCTLFDKFVKKNKEFVDKMIKDNKDSEYWHQLDLIKKQVKGLEGGYDLWKVHNKFKHLSTEELHFNAIFWLNIASELGAYKKILIPESNDRLSDHCSAIVKPLADGSDLFVAHNTWTDYNSMLRVIKKYSFAFNSLLSHKRIAGHSVSMSSYPGFIGSNDDYYILSSGLAVMETTNDNFNMSLYRTVRADNLVYEFERNILANRLASSGKEWTDLFGQYNSGTYNNQFMIVDYNRFKIGTKIADLPNDLLWVLEQMPGYVRAADVTHVLRAQGYWASYNVPYFKDVFDLSENLEMTQKYGPYYSYDNTARAKIFARDESKVTDLKTLYALMRYNDFKNDPLSQCQLYNQTCSPPYSGDMAIAARNDLNDAKGNYSLQYWTRRGEGAIDAKMTNSSMVLNLEMLAVSGPTNVQQPSFQWSTTDIKMSHHGHPDLFNFKPIYIKWYPNRYQIANDV